MTEGSGEFSKPEGDFLDTEGKLLDAVFASDHQVLTWWDLSSEMPFYTPEGLHSIVDDLNTKLERRGEEFRLRFDGSRKGSLGMGVVAEKDYAPLEPPGLRERLEEQLFDQAIEASLGDETRSSWCQLGEGVSVMILEVNTGLFPNPKVAVCAKENDIGGVVLTSLAQLEVLGQFMESGGYVDPVLFASQHGGRRVKVSAAAGVLNSLFKPVFGGEMMAGLYPCGYGYKGESWRRNRLLRSAVMEHFNFRDLERIRSGFDARLFGDVGTVGLQVVIMRTEDFFHEFIPSQAMRVTSRVPHVLIAYPGSLDINEEDVMVAEITKAERDKLGCFGESSVLQLSRFSKKEADAIRKRFGEFLDKLSNKYGYSFAEGTGTASRQELVFPVLPVVAASK